MAEQARRAAAALLLGALATLVVSAACLASPARAADRVYWGNLGVSKISFANLNGSGGADLDTTGATVSGPYGVAIDAAAGRIYWANNGVDGISFANLNGSGGGNLSTSGATLNNPVGVAIDPATGRIYWANSFATKISFARLDGSGGSDLGTGSATVSAPRGVAIDPAAGRIYWANYGLNLGVYKISFAKLDGSGGGDLNTSGATVTSPEGVAIDPAAGRVYWANANAANGISFARLDGSGGGNLSGTGATVSFAEFPALLEAPSATGAPTLTGRSAPGSVLSCSRGSWAPDLLGSFLFRAPQGLAFRWSLGGTDIAGASASSYTPTAVGEYRCTLSASNQAGTTAQTSLPYGVFSLGRLKRNARQGTATLTVTVPGGGPLTLTGKGVVRRRTARRASAPSTGAVSAAGKVRLLIKAKGKTKRKLKRAGKAKVRVTVTYTPIGGRPSAQARTVKLVKRR